MARSRRKHKAKKARKERDSKMYWLRLLVLGYDFKERLRGRRN